MRGFDQDIQFLKGVGPKRAELYHKLGIVTVRDLLTHYPRSYVNFADTVRIFALSETEPGAVRATVLRKGAAQRISGGRMLYKAAASDGFTNFDVVFFGNAYAFDALIEGEDYVFYGKASRGGGRYQMLSPQYQKADRLLPMQPVYKLTEGLTSKMVASNVAQVVEKVSDSMYDPLPDELRVRHGLCHLSFALHNIHFPENENALETARKRLIFEELLTLQLGLFLLKGRSRKQTACTMQRTPLDAFFAGLPFTPTGAQLHAIEQGCEDLRRGVPMNRLVQGDVGSGKTVVAAALCYTAAKNGLQSAVMAPTEILAEQHFHTFEKLLASCGVRVGLLTGSMTAAQKKSVRRQAAQGELDVLVGTHALVQQDTVFGSLGLVVTDEQHRFGVAQRAALAGKGGNPHVLVMSATPIPRTLALILYGDLDVSVIDELPPGRRQVKTYAVGSDKRERMFRFIRSFLEQGRQAYVVCPLVEEGVSELASAEKYAAEVAGRYLSGYRIGILHGRLASSEKEAVMRAFSAGEIDLLVATTVIEVGVDVPNAAAMVIENAERFGLSQLHQLRGRVGRGNYESVCILVTDARNPQAKRRCQVMCATGDGFLIAKEDLRLRGPGDFFGSKQHGLPALKIADMLEDTALLAEAQSEAQDILRRSPDLEDQQFAGLRENVHSLFGQCAPNGYN